MKQIKYILEIISEYMDLGISSLLIGLSVSVFSQSKVGSVLYLTWGLVCIRLFVMNRMIKVLTRENLENSMVINAMLKERLPKRKIQASIVEEMV